MTDDDQPRIPHVHGTPPRPDPIPKPNAIEREVGRTWIERILAALRRNQGSQA